jgi:ATP/maltotriose-dependent transcriptional regulator MalT
MEEEIAALIALAELRHMQGRPEAARELLDDVWPVVESAPYTLLHADACNALVFIERQSGNHGLAVEAAARAYHLAWCDGTPYAYQYGLDIAEEHLTALGVALPQLSPFDPTTTMPMVAVEIDPGPPQE